MSHSFSSLAFLALALSACGGPRADLFPREPRRPSEEGWIAPAEPIAMARAPEDEQRERLAAQERMLQRREKGIVGSPLDIFGEAGVRALIGDLEGVWLVRDLQFPGRVRPIASLDGIGVAAGDYFHLVLLGVGHSKRGPQTIFQSAAYHLRPDISGRIVMQPQGGFSNLSPFIRSVTEKENERDPAMDPRPRSEVGSNQDAPLPRGMNATVENKDFDPDSLVDLRFFGHDRVRLEREPNSWVELDRKTTNRLTAERQGRFLEKLRIDDPDGKRPLEERTMSREVATQLEWKRNLQGHWAVAELRDGTKDPTGRLQAGGYFTFLDGVLIYQITQPVAYTTGQQSTGFQLGVRRYAVGEGSDILLEDIFGVISVEGFGSDGVRRLPGGTRKRMRLIFEGETRVRLENSLDDYIVLERIARPRYVEAEIEAEKLAPAEPSKMPLDLSARRRPG